MKAPIYYLADKTMQLNEHTYNILSELVTSTYINLTYFMDLYFLTKLCNSMKILMT